jgi:hypothetical protein
MKGGEFMKGLVWVLVLPFAAAIGLVPGVFADTMTFTTSSYEAGTGFGNVTNLLSLQDNPSESGSISPAGRSDPHIVKNTSETYTAAQLIALGFNTNNLSVVFNINEPGSARQVDLLGFSLDFYSSTGEPLGSTSVTNGFQQNLVPIGGSGTGTAGYIITYQNTGMLTSFFSNPNNILGGWGSVDKTSSGPENFYLIQSSSSVPEPATMLLLGSGLLGLIGFRRKIKK